ncbi:hypothetical protein BOTBODRAFT_57970 [Botryobasidium botryosum FD-172 SS1]|uniref:RRM domain-containing protein n=1 Tax=Botryobasidium botryosum (strain FD-172 SS1) TaxID=930990 RepID=A0A067M4T9_BOTB1|nr:hypothetical protein BOTBODRAFT_57970 [Botryobasidium botryosum FD-172 SS1]
MSRRLYLGRLPTDTRSEDISKFFEGYGRITDCRVMTGFGFIEFDHAKDADEIVHNFNGKSFMGNNIIVEYAKESRRRDHYDGHGGYPGPPPRARRPPGHRIIVSGVSRDTSWQDLKDFGREAGNVSYADIDRDIPGNGILEYLSLEDAEAAIKILDGKDLRGVTVRVAMAEGRGADVGRERYRSPPRRERSPRRDYDRDYDRERRRSRSPRAPPRRDYEDRRDPYRRDDRDDRDYKRDDRRDDRRDDKERGGAHGDGGWTGNGSGGRY